LIFKRPFFVARITLFLPSPLSLLFPPSSPLSSLSLLFLFFSFPLPSFLQEGRREGGKEGKEGEKDEEERERREKARGRKEEGKGGGRGEKCS